jgi:putative redox protein
MVTVNWLGKMAFEANPESGNKFLMDAYPDSGGEGKGPTPVEALLSSAAACSAMDVVSILAKKQQVVTSYRVEIDGVRGEPGVYPRPFQKITIRHILSGENLDPVAVARAVQLSDEKYCTVVTTLRAAPEVVAEWSIE